MLMLCIFVALFLRKIANVSDLKHFNGLTSLIERSELAFNSEFSMEISDLFCIEFHFPPLIILVQIDFFWKLHKG